MFFRIAIIIALSLLSFVTSSNELRTYEFTASFVDCVKRYSNQKEEFVRSGVAESGLMNGRGVISPTNLDGTYWTYMDCLTPTRSGTASGGSLVVKQTCPGINFNIGDRRIYVPPGTEGKKVGVASKFWVCTSGNWTTSTGTIVMPGSSDIGAPREPGSSDCNPQVVTVGRCTFNLQSTKNGFNAEDRFGTYFGDPWNGFHGSYVASCNNGNFIPVNSRCEADACTPGETVEWSSSGTSGLALCKGQVEASGEVVSERPELQFFQSPIDALNFTKVPIGSATFSCKNGEWVKPANLTCRNKLPAELVCDSVLGLGGSPQFYCE